MRTARRRYDPKPGLFDSYVIALSWITIFALSWGTIIAVVWCAKEIWKSWYR